MYLALGRDIVILYMLAMMAELIRTDEIDFKDVVKGNDQGRSPLVFSGDEFKMRCVSMVVFFLQLYSTVK